MLSTFIRRQKGCSALLKGKVSPTLVLYFTYTRESRVPGMGESMQYCSSLSTSYIEPCHFLCDCFISTCAKRMPLNGSR